MKKLIPVLLIATLLIGSNTVLAQSEEEAEVRHIPISPGDLSVSVEEGLLTISAEIKAYPKAKFYLNESSDSEEIGSRENISSDTIEYDLMYEKANGIESLYKEKLTASKEIRINRSTDLLLEYRMSESERENRVKSATLISMTPRSIDSVSRNYFDTAVYANSSTEDQTSSSTDDSVRRGNYSKQDDSSTISEPVDVEKDIEVSSQYMQELDGMSKKELKNRVIYLRKKVVKLENAMVGISESVGAVSDLVEADMGSNTIDVEKEKQEEDNIWKVIVQSVFQTN